MRYSIRRIGLGSALRMSLLLGWAVVLCPALCLAGLAVQALRTLSRALAQVQLHPGPVVSAGSAGVRGWDEPL